MIETSGNASVTLAVVPAIHPETALSKLGGRWVVATPDHRWHSFESNGELSDVGERIVDLVDGTRSVADIVSVLVDEFDVSRAVAEEDTLNFVALLVNKKVLTF